MHTPQMPKRRVLAFGITLNTQHTNCNALPAPHRPVLLPGSWEFADVVWEVACCSEKPGWTHDTAKTEVSGRNGTWDAAGGHFNGTWPHRVARSYPPFVTQRNLLNQATRKSQYVPKCKAYLFTPLTSRGKGPSNLSSGIVACGHKRMSLYERQIRRPLRRPQLTSNTSRRLDTNLIWRYHFSRR